jgi:hypothetical protein
VTPSLAASKFLANEDRIQTVPHFHVRDRAQGIHCVRLVEEVKRIPNPVTREVKVLVRYELGILGLVVLVEVIKGALCLPHSSGFVLCQAGERCKYEPA